MKIVEFRESVFGHFYNDFYWFLGSNPQVDFVLLVTSTDSFSELRKYFLDRKKVLKSLEANSFISPENVGGWGSCRTNHHILKVLQITKNACTPPQYSTRTAGSWTPAFSPPAHRAPINAIHTAQGHRIWKMWGKKHKYSSKRPKSKILTRQ